MKEVHSLWPRLYQALPRVPFLQCHPATVEIEDRQSNDGTALSAFELGTSFLNTDSVSLGSGNASTSSFSGHTLQAGGSLCSSATSRPDGSLFAKQINKFSHGCSTVTQGSRSWGARGFAPPTRHPHAAGCCRNWTRTLRVCWMRREGGLAGIDCTLEYLLKCHYWIIMRWSKFVKTQLFLSCDQLILTYIDSSIHRCGRIITTAVSPSLQLLWGLNWTLFLTENPDNCFFFLFLCY